MYQFFVCILCANASLFIVLLVLLVWTSVVVAVQNPKAPKWPDCYSVKAILRLPYAELEEPITAYYEGAKNRSRVDYYGWIFFAHILLHNVLILEYCIAVLVFCLYICLSPSVMFMYSGHIG